MVLEGNGTLINEFTYGGHDFNGITGGDFDGDGTDEIAVYRRDGNENKIKNRIVVLEGNGTSTGGFTYGGYDFCGITGGNFIGGDAFDDIALYRRQSKAVKTKNLVWIIDLLRDMGGVRNLALNKTAIQSSTSQSAPASRAVDGDTSGQLSNGSVTHTTSSSEPWWQVDLGAVADITDINVYNRTDCCTGRLTNYHVFVSNVPFDSNTVSGLQSQTGVKDLHFIGQAGSPTTHVINRTGRYVRIQLEGTGKILSLAEVGVLGSFGSTNLALNKTATQSSTSQSAPAFRAVDGDTSGHWSNGSVTQTYTSSEPWWQVDLGAATDIADIKVYNRTDCCSDRLTNYHVFVSNVPFTSTTVSGTQAQTGIGDFVNTSQAGSPTTHIINRTGRYVRIQLEDTGKILSLAEVEVLGSFSPVDTPTLEVRNIGVDEKTITHSYGDDEAPTEYMLTLADGTAAPDWISISDGKVMVAPSYDVVESSATHKFFDFMISTVGKTPNAIGEFRITVVNRSETPIIYDGNPIEVTVDEDATGNYNILDNYTSSIGSTLNVTNNSNILNWVFFRGGGSIIVIPGNDEVGTHQVPFRVVDQRGNGLTGTLELTVTNINDAPKRRSYRPIVKVLESLEYWAIYSDTTETFDLSTVFYDVDANDVLTYELIADDDPYDGHDGVVRNVKVSNPDFVSIENSTLKFSFTPESENYIGSYQIGIKATDTSGESVTSPLKIAVGSSTDVEDPSLVVMTAAYPETTDDFEGSAISMSATMPATMPVRLGGSTISTREETIRERGVIYSASANNRESLIIGGQGASREIMANNEDNSFSEKNEGLTAGMTYYYRAYATGNDGMTTYGDVKDFTLETDTTLGNEDFEKTGFSISPNPTTGILNITALEKADYRLLNIRGQILKKGTLAAGGSKINLSSLAKGIYLLNVKTGKGSFTKKVVKN